MRCFGYDDSVMRDLTLLFIHLLVTIPRLFGRGGARSIVAESLLVKQQLLIVNRSRERAPVLRPADRIIVGLCAMLMHPTRVGMYDLIGHFVYLKLYGGFSYEGGRKRNKAQAAGSKPCG